MAAERKSQSSFPPGAGGDTENFINLLHSHARAGGRGSHPASGFLVLVPQSKKLDSLQKLCLEIQQPTVTCLTARYRLQASTIFGTLLAAFSNDLRTRGSTRLKTRGIFAPDLADENWNAFLEGPFGNWLASAPAGSKGSFSAAQVQDLWKTLSHESALPDGKLLVLFAEVEESPDNKAEWEQARANFIPHLPGQVGLVLSGYPQGFELSPAPELSLKIKSLVFRQPPPQIGDSPQNTDTLFFRFKPAALRNDRTAREDHLGVNRFAEAMARFILHPQTHPPLTLGIHGHWGKGKSSFMALVDMALVKLAKVDFGALPQRLADLYREIADLETKLENTTESASETLTRVKNSKTAEHGRVWHRMQRLAEKRILTVNFNAWQFQDAQQIWSGLASVISERIEKSLSWGQRVQMRVRYTFTKRRTDIFLHLFLPVTLVLLVGAAAWVIQPLRDYFSKLLDESQLFLLEKVLFPTGSFLLLTWLVATRLLKVAQPVSERVLGYVQMPKYREQMGFQHRVMEDLQFVYQFLKSKKPECKVVVYIDDLDRCSDEKIMEVLQSINLILGGSELFVFLGMDTDMIYRAIRGHYDQRRHETFMPENFADEYLRKIIQLSFYLPETKVEQRFEYVRTLFSANTRLAYDAQKKPQPTLPAAETLPTEGESLHYDLETVQDLTGSSWREVLDTVEELQAFEDLRHYLKDNPREIKRVINVHRLVKILLQGAESHWPPERQRRLVKWLVFCSNWPYLIDDLLEERARMPAGCNCLLQLYDKLEVDAGNEKELAQLREFAGQAEPLSPEDLDEEFIMAAHVAYAVENLSEPRKQERRRFGYQAKV